MCHNDNTDNIFIFIYLIFMSHIVLYFFTYYSGTLHLHRQSLDTFYGLNYEVIANNIAMPNGRTEIRFQFHKITVVHCDGNVI